MLRFINLASGSKGNASLVQAWERGGAASCLLVDCGLALKELVFRLESAGVQSDELDAIFITHEHADHIGSAFQVALQLHIPVYMGRGTWLACSNQDGKSVAAQNHATRARAAWEQGLVRFAADEVAFSIGAIEVTPVTVPHDAKEPLQLLCSDGQRKLGILTDLGHVSRHVEHHFADCTALMLECNHDSTMLEQSRYPAFLRQRVGGDFGHLSNAQSAHALQSWLHPQFKHLLCAHLSEQNNHPELVRNSMASVLGCNETEILCATQHSPSAWLDC